MNPSKQPPGRHLALFTSSLAGGGVQRSMRDLAVAFARQGYRVDLLVCHANGDAAPDLAEAGVRCTTLPASSPLVGRALVLRADPRAWPVLLRTVLLPFKSWTKLRYLAGLADYLRREQPEVLLAAMTQCNLVALWARAYARVPTRIAVSEHNMLSKYVAYHRRKWRWRYLPGLVAHCYRRADAIITVSRAVADDLAAITGLPRARIESAPNPTVNQTLRAGREQPLAHPWFSADAPPVVLGVGRLAPQKNPETLLRAFAALRARRDVRLVMLGDGPLHSALTALADALHIAADVDWIGWDDNPFAYMARASVFVLPSLWEGLPGVLIQAMACGCPVVATDCPGGSAEIVDHGRLGPLVPMRDPAAMADAIAVMLDWPTSPALLAERAEDYSAEVAVRRYIQLLLGKDDYFFVHRPFAPTQAHSIV